MDLQPISSRGSLWHRWDPHIHTPGTVLNDQFGGSDPWEVFLRKIEQSDPPIRALGITDYCSIENYLATIERWRNGRLEGVGLIFPNVELRLSIETSKASAVNLHLLFSPHDTEHAERIRGFLSGLEFRHQGQPYRCERSDLMRLGRVHGGSALSDKAAMEVGTMQSIFSLASRQERHAVKQWSTATLS